MRAKVAPTLPRKSGKVSLEPPVTVRALSEALGLKSVELIFKLRSHGQASANINSTIPEGVVEEIALETGNVADDLLTQMYHNSKRQGAVPPTVVEPVAPAPPAENRAAQPGARQK